MTDDTDVGDAVARGHATMAGCTLAASPGSITYDSDGLSPVTFPVGSGAGEVSRIVAVTRSAYLVSSWTRRELDQVMDIELRDVDDNIVLSIPAGSRWTDQRPRGNALSRSLWPEQTDRERLVPAWSEAEVVQVARAAGIPLEAERGPSLGGVLSLSDATTTGTAQGLGGQLVLIAFGVLILLAIAVAIGRDVVPTLR